MTTRRQVVTGANGTKEGQAGNNPNVKRNKQQLKMLAFEFADVLGLNFVRASYFPRWYIVAEHTLKGITWYLPDYRIVPVYSLECFFAGTEAQIHINKEVTNASELDLTVIFMQALSSKIQVSPAGQIVVLKHCK